MKIALIILLFLLLLILLGLYFYGDIDGFKYGASSIYLKIDKEKNQCNKDSDCTYREFADGCLTQEYVNTALKRPGHISNAPSSRNGVVCKCKNNYCAER